MAILMILLLIFLHNNAVFSMEQPKKHSLFTSKTSHPSLDTFHQKDKMKKPEKKSLSKKEKKTKKSCKQETSSLSDDELSRRKSLSSDSYFENSKKGVEKEFFKSAKKDERTNQGVKTRTFSNFYAEEGESNIPEKPYYSNFSCEEEEEEEEGKSFSASSYFQPKQERTSSFDLFSDDTKITKKNSAFPPKMTLKSPDNQDNNVPKSPRKLKPSQEKQGIQLRGSKSLEGDGFSKTTTKDFLSEDEKPKLIRTHSQTDATVKLHKAIEEFNTTKALKALKNGAHLFTIDRKSKQNAFDHIFSKFSDISSIKRKENLLKNVFSILSMLLSNFSYTENLELNKEDTFYERYEKIKSEYAKKDADYHFLDDLAEERQSSLDRNLKTYAQKLEEKEFKSCLLQGGNLIGSDSTGRTPLFTLLDSLNNKHKEPFISEPIEFIFFLSGFLKKIDFKHQTLSKKKLSDVTSPYLFLKTPNTFAKTIVEGLEKCNTSQEQQDYLDRYLLIHYIRKNNLDKVKRSIASRADLNSKEYQTENTPLMVALTELNKYKNDQNSDEYKKSWELTVRLLLAKENIQKIDFGARNNEGKSAYDLATDFDMLILAKEIKTAVAFEAIHHEPENVKCRILGVTKK